MTITNADDNELGFKFVRI